MSYTVYMSTTLTIRTDESLREALEKRAEAQGKTLSEVAREILLRALEERPVHTRAGHIRGKLELSRRTTPEAWRKELQKRNWRS